MLTIEWADDTDKEWLHDLSRSLSKHISAIREVENVRMQIIKNVPVQITSSPKESKGRWSDEEIIQAIQAYAGKHGAPPVAHDWDVAGPWPNKKTVMRRFGSWGNAMVAAGFERPKPRGNGNPLDDLFRQEFLNIKGND